MNPKDNIPLNEHIDAAVMTRLHEDFNNVIGVIDHLGDPIILGTGPRNGTETITSDVSNAWPMSDSGLGATASPSGTGYGPAKR